MVIGNKDKEVSRSRLSAPSGTNTRPFQRPGEIDFDCISGQMHDYAAADRTLILSI